MTENYVELLVKRKSSRLIKSIHFVCMMLGMLLLAVGLLYFVALFLLLGALLLLGSYLIEENVNVEYEYLYLDKSFYVDQIKNRKKRKKIAEFDLTTALEVLAPAGSHHLDQMKSKTSKVKDYTSGSEDARVYEMVVHVEKELWLVKIEMTDDLYEQMYIASPRKVFKE